MNTAYFYETGENTGLLSCALVLEVLSLQTEKIVFAALCEGLKELDRSDYASSFVSGRLREWFYECYMEKVTEGNGCWLENDLKNSLVNFMKKLVDEMVHIGSREQITWGTSILLVLCHDSDCYLLQVGSTKGMWIGKDMSLATKEKKKPDGTIKNCIGSFSYQGMQWVRMHERGGILLLGNAIFWNKTPKRDLVELTKPGLPQTDYQLQKRLDKLAGKAKEKMEKGEEHQLCAVAIVIRN